MNLLVTSDKLGSSGASVTNKEFEFLKETGDTHFLNPEPQLDPFQTDRIALQMYLEKGVKYKVAHFYAGCYSQLIKELKKDGTKITYTAAAHDINFSISEFKRLGVPFDFNHLTDPVLFKQYLEGYLEADCVICPSKISKETMEGYGCKNVCIIPHGCEKPSHVNKLPAKFTVGYLGQIGPDKGITYLLEAWSDLNYNDSQLVIAGRQSCDGYFINLLRNHLKKGSVHLAGYVDNVSDFYNSCSVYVQPSVTEGFGIEVIEALSHGRPVICSDGAGAVDFVNEKNGTVVKKRNSKDIKESINFYKNNPEVLKNKSDFAKSKDYSWETVKSLYLNTWRTLQ